MLDIEPTPYSALFAAVIQQAIDDALGTKAIPQYDRDQATQFLTARQGQWAASRAAYCDALGIDPDVLRERSLRRLSLPETDSSLP